MEYLIIFFMNDLERREVGTVESTEKKGATFVDKMRGFFRRLVEELSPAAREINPRNVVPSTNERRQWGPNLEITPPGLEAAKGVTAMAPRTAPRGRDFAFGAVRNTRCPSEISLRSAREAPPRTSIRGK